MKKEILEKINEIQMEVFNSHPESSYITQLDTYLQTFDVTYWHTTGNEVTWMETIKLSNQDFRCLHELDVLLNKIKKENKNENKC